MSKLKKTYFGFNMRKGFSLLELLVVITIVGLLAAIAVPAYRQYSDRANIAKIRNIIRYELDDFEATIAAGKTFSNKTLNCPLQNVIYNQSQQTLSMGLCRYTDDPVNGLPFLRATLYMIYYLDISDGVVSWTCELAFSGNNTAYGGDLTNGQIAAYFPDCPCNPLTGPCT